MNDVTRKDGQAARFRYAILTAGISLVEARLTVRGLLQ